MTTTKAAVAEAKESIALSDDGCWTPAPARVATLRALIAAAERCAELERSLVLHRRELTVLRNAYLELKITPSRKRGRKT